MQIKDFLNEVCSQIKYKPIRKSISQELEVHIEELKENYINEGLNESTAEIKAIEQMGNAEEIGKKLNKIHKPKFDWKLVLISIVLLCFGILISYIRTTSLVIQTGGANYIVRYMAAIIIGILLSIIIYFFDYTKIYKYSNYIYILATLLIIWTLLNGTHVNGIPYLRLGTVAFPVNIITMPLYIIAFIGFLMNKKSDSRIQRLIHNEVIKNNYNLLKNTVLSIMSICLLLYIPSKASALILEIIYLILASIKIWNTSEHRKRNITILWGIAFFIGIVLVLYILLNSPYIMQRIMATFKPEEYMQTDGWVGANRKVVINSAQSFGEADDMSNALNLFDEGTNYAFIAILAHYGWVVAIALVTTIILLCVKLILNSIKIKDFYGKLIIVGISTMFIMQSLFNILMNLNLGIEANFNIPFVSYGFMELIVNIVSLSLILSIYRRKDIIVV